MVDGTACGVGYPIATATGSAPAEGTGAGAPHVQGARRSSASSARNSASSARTSAISLHVHTRLVYVSVA